MAIIPGMFKKEENERCYEKCVSIWATLMKIVFLAVMVLQIQIVMDVQYRVNNIL